MVANLRHVGAEEELEPLAVIFGSELPVVDGDPEALTLCRPAR